MSHPGPNAPTPSPAGDDVLALVPERHAVRVGGVEVAFTVTQYRLLAFLISQRGRAVGRAELVERGIGDVVELRTVDVHVKEIRRKLGAHGALVQTVRGVGYRFADHV